MLRNLEEWVTFRAAASVAQSIGGAAKASEKAREERDDEKAV